MGEIMQDFRRKFEDKKTLLLFPNVKKEINGRKFNYGGEYPFSPDLMQRLRSAMKHDGYDVFYQHRKENGTMVVWWKRK